MRIRKNGWLSGWRAAFAAIAVNIVFSFGAGFLPVKNIHISMLITTSLYTVFAVCCALFYSRKNISTGFYDIGFCGFSPTVLPLLIFMPVAAEMFCLFLTTPLTLVLSILFGAETKEQVLAPEGIGSLCIAFVYMCVLAPVSEEILFRGIVYKCFERRSVFDALLWSSVAFSAAHLDARSFVPIFFVGLVLALFRFATGSVFASMIAHSAMNACGLFMMYAGSDNPVYLVMTYVLAAAFPFIMVWFLKHTEFPVMKKSGEKRGVSVFLILIIVVFLVFQASMLINNLTRIINGHTDFFNEFNSGGTYDFEYKFE